ncbi:MAG: homoserine kinase [Deltaproteobacteria bacterium]|nr:homoserine kinase [Deltaproteobacteria bacterium]
MSNPQEVHVFVPATVANVACGFDILGFAVSRPGDEVIARLCDKPGVHIKSITGDGGRLPLDVARNTAAVSALEFLKHIKADKGVELEIIKKMPLGSGLGSSAASAAAGVYAANLLFGSPLEARELVAFAMAGEKAACGTAHADNVGPALLGGFVLIRSYDPLDIVSIPAPPSLFCTILNPHLEVRTEDARRILRKDISLKNAITQWGNIAGLIAGLLKNDIELIGRSMQDVVIEPERALLIPGFSGIKQAAIAAGALGCSISGSGPSIFALSVSVESANRISEAMKEETDRLGISSDTYISPINLDGPVILSKR